MKKVLVVLLCAAMLATSLAGCGSTDSKSESVAESAASAVESAVESVEAGDDGKYVFGVSLFYRSDEFYVDIENMMKLKAEELGVELRIQDANTDSSVQMRQFEDFIQMGVDAIIFSPCDPVACSSAVEAANAAGIPVFTYDGTMEDNSGITAGMYSDFYADGNAAGKWASEYITKNLGGNANVAILDFPGSPVVCGLRADGFEDGVKEAGPGVNVVARQDGHATRTGGMEVMENILTENENKIDIVFTINYESAAGAASALEAAGVDAKVVCVAWGEEALTKLSNRDPWITALLLGDPSDQAEIIQVAKDFLDGKQVEKETMYSYYMVTADDVDQKIDWKAIIDLRN